MHFLKWNGICLLLLLNCDLFGADKQPVIANTVPTLRSLAFKVVHTQLAPDFTQMRAACPVLIDQAEEICIRGTGANPGLVTQMANLLLRVQACGVAFEPARNCRNNADKHWRRSLIARTLLESCESIPTQVAQLVQWVVVPVESINGHGPRVFHDLVHLAIIGLSKPSVNDPGQLGYKNSTACIADLLEKNPGDIAFRYKNKTVWELAKEIPEGSSSSSNEVVQLLNKARIEVYGTADY